MAATTITRDTITDGSGGTVLNSAFFGSAIYDNIDDVLAADITFGGTVTAEGAGTHTFSAGTSTGNILAVRNTTAGTGAFGQIRVGNDLADNTTIINALSSTWNTLGANWADGTTFQGTGAGGVSIAADDATGGDVRQYARGGTKLSTFDGESHRLSGGLPGTYGLSGVLSDSIDGSQHSIGAVLTEVDFATYTLPANTMSATRQVLEVYGWGTFVNNSQTKRVRAYLGTTTIFDSALDDWGANGAGVWHVVCRVIRTGDTAQSTMGDMQSSGPTTAGLRSAVVEAGITEDLTTALTVKFTGIQGTATAGNITQEGFYVKLCP